MAQDTGKFRINTKDQYYTKRVVAAHCVAALMARVAEPSTYQWIEPSAGAGVFLKALPPGCESVGMDLEPKGPGILEGDFLAWAPISPKKRIVFGNPPFGRQGCLAKAFIKHASMMADVIAFILPRSFVKPSMSRAFPLAFHCDWSEELVKDAFEVNGDPYDVPCVFQIWTKRTTNRIVEEPVEAIGFVYVKSDQPYDIAFKRAGGSAGKCCLKGTGTYNPQYHYFLKLDSTEHQDAIVEAINRHVFPSNTVGPRSLSKSEVNEVVNVIIAEAQLPARPVDQV
jgi:hypothetical protein